MRTMREGGQAFGALRQRLGSMQLYVISGDAGDASRTLAILEQALAGGADVVQLRKKTWEKGPLLELAGAVRRLTRDAHALFIVNDHLDVAMAAEADGVHLGQDDLPAAVARRFWPGHIVGRSSHSVAQALAAEAEGADYVAVGPVFSTTTKPARSPVGLALLRDIAPRLRLPFVAIGGIDERNAEQVLQAGARALAVVRAVYDAPLPRQAAATLKARVQHAIATATPSP
jgi:thiamine-phosphate pyrophosphorylase